MNMPSISVVIPLFNKEAHIKKTINDVLLQTYSAIEIIVVDDGSTDNSAHVVKELCLQHSHIKLIRQNNLGVSMARNNGVRAAKGSHIAFLDAGDGWSPHHLANLNELFLRFPEATLFGTGYQTIIDQFTVRSPKNRLIHEHALPYLLSQYFQVAAAGDLPLHISGVAIRRLNYWQYGGCPKGESNGEDQYLYTKAALAGPIAIHPMVTSFYHLDASERADDKARPLRESRFSRLLNTKLERFEPSMQKEVTAYCARHLVDIARLNIERGFLKQAKALIADERVKALPLHRAWRKVQIGLKA